MIKILLVEDNPLNQDMLSRRLVRQGYEVVVATDGAAGISMAKTECPALILMDMSLPIMDGWEATQRLKTDVQTQAIPVIALTAHAMVGDHEKALAAGCDDYATKPVEFKQLLKTIRAFTGGLATPVASTPVALASSQAQANNPVFVNKENDPKNVKENGKAFDSDSSKTHPESPFTLLLINDNAINRQILSAHLQRQGYSAIEAADANTAFSILRDFSVDLILLDITVPENANLTTLQQLRATYAKTTLPVIVMTADDSDEETVQAFELGVNDYITKPINLAVVMARIQSQLQILQSTRLLLTTTTLSQENTSEPIVSPGTTPHDMPAAATTVPAAQSKTAIELASAEPVALEPVPLESINFEPISKPATAKSYPLNYVFSRSALGQVQLIVNPHISNPDTSEAALCLAETFSPSIQDDAVLEDFRDSLAVERSRLKAISRHERIAEILSFVKQEDAFGWLQAYVEGQLLSDRFPEGKRAEPHRVLQSMRDMLEALLPFHAQKIVHSSMQPEHLWCCAKNGRLRLLNLGLSQRLSAYLCVRSPENHKLFDYEHSYMPIEQRIGEPVLSSDIYSVGLIALQMLTGKTPEILTNILLSSDSSFQQLPHVTPALAKPLARMLSQDYQERYASAEAALAAIGA